MGESEEWTQANLQKLLSAMKSSIPQPDRKQPYTRGLKSVDWNELAFPPFSPEACQEKWTQILQKMCKIRTLTDLIVEAEGVISNPDKNIKIHPELPRRPTPPNAMFVEANAANYKKKHPNMGQQKRLKNLVRKYQTLPEEEKAQYVEKFKLENKEYKERMEVFSQQYNKSTGPTHKTTGPTHKTTGPTHKTTGPTHMTTEKKLSAKCKAVTEDTEGIPAKPPINGYNLFCKEQLTPRKGINGINCVTVWAQGWRNMTEKERQKYNSRSKEMKSQYEVDLNEYLMNFDGEKQKQILKKKGIKRPRVSTRTTRKHPRKFDGEPKIQSRSGWQIFCKKQMFLLRKKYPNSRDRFAMVIERWKVLPTVEKECYTQEAFEDNKKYSMELQNWFATLTTEEQEHYRKHNHSKLQYLDLGQMEVCELEEPHASVHRPSDSEDEETEDSSDEEENNLESEVEEDEDSDVIGFEVY